MWILERMGGTVIYASNFLFDKNDILIVQRWKIRINALYCTICFAIGPLWSTIFQSVSELSHVLCSVGAEEMIAVDDYGYF